MLIKHQLRSNFFIIFGFHPLFDKEPFFVKSFVLFRGRPGSNLASFRKY